MKNLIIIILITSIWIVLSAHPPKILADACGPQNGEVYGSYYSQYCYDNTTPVPIQCDCSDPTCPNHQNTYCDPGVPPQGPADCEAACTTSECSAINALWPCNVQGSCSWTVGLPPNLTYCPVGGTPRPTRTPTPLPTVTPTPPPPVTPTIGQYRVSGRYVLIGPLTPTPSTYAGCIAYGPVTNQSLNGLEVDLNPPLPTPTRSVFSFYYQSYDGAFLFYNVPNGTYSVNGEIPPRANMVCRTGAYGNGLINNVSVNGADVSGLKFVYAPFTPTPTPPACNLPTLISPPNGTCLNVAPTLTAARGGGNGNQIQLGVDNTSIFSDPLLWSSNIITSDPASASYIAGVNPNTTYYWSARTSNSNPAVCTQSPWQSSRSYTIDRTPPLPPTAGFSYTQDINNPGKYFVTLSWTAVNNDIGCEGMATNPYSSQTSLTNFGNVITGWNTNWTSERSQTSTTSYSCGTTFYGRVRTQDAGGNQSPWSTVVNITVPACVGDPAPIGNHDDPIDCTQTHGFACDSSNFNKSINVLLYKDGPFSPIPGLGGTPLPTVVANLQHAGSGFYCGNTTNHGFTLALDPTYGFNDGQKHTLYAYAVGINPSGTPNNNNSLLSSSPKKLICFSSATPTPTPLLTATPTPTPTPAPWVQLNAASFQTSGFLNDIIPKTPLAYDGTAGQPYFIIQNASPLQDPGVVTSSGINLGGNPLADVSQKHWANSNYHANGVNIESFINYVKSKRAYKLIKTSDLSQIDPTKINIFTVDVNITSSTDADKLYATTPIMIIFENANLTINYTGIFNSLKKPIVILASNEGIGGTITFGSGITDANGIFIADSVDVGTTVNQGLSIDGNLITNFLTNGRNWKNNNKPSLYIISDATMYISLFDLMSKPTYEWTQLQ